jgi:cyclase
MMNTASVTFVAGPARSLTRFGERPLYREGLYQVARDVYAWLVPNGSWGETNLGFVDGGNASALIDTCWDPRYTAEALTHLEPYTRRAPIALVINSHADGDHCWGNQLLSHLPIVATQRCIDHFAHTTPADIRRLTSASRVLGPLPRSGFSELSRYMRSMVAPYDHESVRLTPPSRGFQGELEERVGNTTLTLHEVGPAHTDGDCIVHLPEQRVVFVADLLFVGVTPVIWAGPLERVIAGLEKVLALRADVIVPGHGPLACERDVRLAIDYWDFVQNELHGRMREGMPSALAASQLLHGARFASSAFAHWDSPERLVTSAAALYRHWGCHEGVQWLRGTELGSKLGTLVTLRAQARLAYALPRATPAVMHGSTP